MGKSKFPVYGEYDKAIGGTVTIDRVTDVFSFRPKGRHRTYDLTLSVVARMVMMKIIFAEVAEKKAAKKAKRKGL